MFKIRAAQMQAFAASEERDFERRTALRLRQYFPELRGRSDEDLLDLVRKGKERAGRYGIRSHYHVSLYVGLTAQFGEGFDTDPALPWAAEILQREGIHAAVRIGELYLRALPDAPASGPEPK